jgi:hypothetical protein
MGRLVEKTRVFECLSLFLQNRERFVEKDWHSDLWNILADTVFNYLPKAGLVVWVFLCWKLETFRNILVKKLILLICFYLQSILTRYSIIESFIARQLVLVCALLTQGCSLQVCQLIAQISCSTYERSIRLEVVKNRPGKFRRQIKSVKRLLRLGQLR